MKIATCAIMLLVLASFNFQNPKIKTGIYGCVRPGKFEQAWQRYFHGITRYTVGSELIIGADSTFKYTTCGNILTGTWSAIDDSLFLHVTMNRWRKDSLDRFGFNGTWPEIPPDPIGFKIKTDYLEQIKKLNATDKDIEVLKFNHSPDSDKNAP